MKNMKEEVDMVIAELPKEADEVKMPGYGCRRLTVISICPMFTRTGEYRVHVDFDYKGYKFGQTFKPADPLLKDIFGGTIRVDSIGRVFFAEIEIKTGTLSGKPYPKVIGVETIS